MGPKGLALGCIFQGNLTLSVQKGLWEEIKISQAPPLFLLFPSVPGSWGKPEIWVARPESTMFPGTCCMAMVRGSSGASKGKRHAEGPSSTFSAVGQGTGAERWDLHMHWSCNPPFKGLHLTSQLALEYLPWLKTH